jgi:hypothetical protein
MSTAALAEQLRERARILRRLAATIATSRALDAHVFAGPQTWIGPTPQHCHESLRMLRRRLLDHHDALGRAALMLDRRAAELERLPAPHSVGRF